MSEQKQVFISYCREDQQIADRLYNDLKKAGITPWIDKEDILIGQEWKTAIREAIKKSSFFIALLSSHSVSKRGYIQKEIRIALEILDEMPPNQIFILPIRLDDCIPPYKELQDIHWGDIFSSYQKVIERILRIIQGKDVFITYAKRYEHKTLLHYIEAKKINTLDMEFIYIQPGKFMMGTPKNEKEGYPDEILHGVTLTKGFYMQSTPVTQKQWEVLMGGNPAKFKGEDYPVEQVSWNDVQDFIKSLNDRGGTDKYRLPTEAEWEYACRAGSNKSYHFGNDNKILREYAWYDKETRGTHPVGKMNPNAWGLYDMHGNVWEWCSDCYGDYPNSHVTDPEGPIDGFYRVLRGGAWADKGRVCRSAKRKSSSPNARFSNYGFRLVLLP